MRKIKLTGCTKYLYKTILKGYGTARFIDGINPRIHAFMPDKIYIFMKHIMCHTHAISGYFLYYPVRT